MEGSSDTPPLHHLPGKSKDRKDLSTCHDSPIGSPPIPYRPIPACQVIKRWLHGNNPEAKLLAALVNVSTSCQRFLYEDHAVLPWMPQTGRPPAASLSLSFPFLRSLGGFRWLFHSDAVDDNDDDDEDDSSLSRGVSSRSEFLGGGGV